MANKKELIKLGFSCGDLNGVGIELLLRAFDSGHLYNHCIPVLYAEAWVLEFYSNLLNTVNISSHNAKNPDDLKEGVINLRSPGGARFDINPGNSTSEAGTYSLKSLEAAIKDIREGVIQNLVTLPINKHNIASDSFQFAGHTDFLASAFETNDYMMILAGENVRVGVVTGHIPISEVAANITEERLEKTIRIFHESLTIDFRISKPKIAILGLNPHSGDKGVIGSEEQEVIQPLVVRLIDEGLLVYGPYPADGFFGSGQYKSFDGVLAMYHDQGLIPFKQLDFDEGVNYTAGLPMVRTSPDHGTAYDLAGKGKASVNSLVHAIFMNNQIYRNRLEYMELNKDPLPFTRFRREKFSIGVPNLK